MPVQSAICWPANNSVVTPAKVPAASNSDDDNDSCAKNQPEKSARVNRAVLPNVRGYAYSGAGAKVGFETTSTPRCFQLGFHQVVRVDVSADGGETWNVATLEPIDTNKPECWLRQRNLTSSKHRYSFADYGWRRWRIDLELPENSEKCQIVAKAIDEHYNTQPGDAAAIWNMRGSSAPCMRSWHCSPLLLLVRLTEQQLAPR